MLGLFDRLLYESTDYSDIYILSEVEQLLDKYSINKILTIILFSSINVQYALHVFLNTCTSVCPLYIILRPHSKIQIHVQQKIVP